MEEDYLYSQEEEEETPWERLNRIRNDIANDYDLTVAEFGMDSVDWMSKHEFITQSMRRFQRPPSTPITLNTGMYKTSFKEYDDARVKKITLALNYQREYKAEQDRITQENRQARMLREIEEYGEAETAKYLKEKRQAKIRSLRLQLKKDANK